MKVRTFSQEWTQKWDDYVNRHPESSFFHQIGWKRVIERSFGHKSRYLLAEEEGDIRGILPLFSITSRLFGRSLVSLPFAVYGGMCFDNREAECLIVDEAKRIAKEEDFEYLELRNIKKNGLDFPVKNLYETFIKELPADPRECWRSLKRKARGSAKKGVVSSLKAEMNPDRLKEFYDIYNHSLRNLGTPIFSFRFFQNLLEEFGRKINILSVKLHDKVIASVMVFFFKNTVNPYYGGSLKEYLGYSPNNFMYWKLMEYGCNQGYRYFDFGRSRKDAGSYHFKEHWGITPQPLPYQYYLNKTDKIPNVSPANPKYDLPRRIWKRLPLSVTKVLGPPLVKYLV
ncbi:MAG: FemAB family XrtA/PEP-CTERM system-associated protein [bacterium]